MALTRGVPALMMAALESRAAVYPVMFAHVDWPGDPVRVHSATGTITWGGHDWAPLNGIPAGFGALPGEDQGIEGGQAEMWIAGSLDVLAGLLGAAIKSRPVEVWVGLLTARPGTPGAALVSDPLPIYRGTMQGQSLPVTMRRGAVMAQMRVNLASGVPPRGAASLTHSPEDEVARTGGDSTLGRHLAHRLKKVVNPDLWPAVT